MMSRDVRIPRDYGLQPLESMEAAYQSRIEFHPLRILLWSPGGAGRHYHGPGTNAFHLYSCGARSDFCIDLAHGRPGHRTYDLYKEQFLIARTSGHLLHKLLFLPKAEIWVRKHIRNYDVFYGMTGFYASVLPAYRAQSQNVPSFIKLVNYKIDLKSEDGWKSIFGLAGHRRKLVSQLSGVVSISKGITQELLGYGIPESKIAEIPNGVDTNIFYPASSGSEKVRLREELGLGDVPAIVFLGGMVKRKRPHLIIDALGQLRASGIECQLIMAGPDTEEDYAQALRDHAKDVGVDHCIKWLGHIANPEELLRSSDIFCLPSSVEGMPNSLLQAMASGLPSVACPIPGVVDLIDDDVTGRLVAPNATDIAAALTDYIESSGLRRRHGAAALDVIEARYSCATVLDAQLRMFRRVLAGGSARE